MRAYRLALYGHGSAHRLHRAKSVLLWLHAVGRDLPPGFSVPGSKVIGLFLDDVIADLKRYVPRLQLCVPKTSSASCDQVIFVDQATDACLSSDAVLTEIDWLG